MAVTPRVLLAGAALCAVAFLVVLGLAYGEPHARWLDASGLQGFIGLQGPSVTPVAEWLVTLGDPLRVALFGGGLALVALARGRWQVALLVVALVGLTSVSSQLLKALLAHTRPEGSIAGAFVAAEAYPSGHATAAMALAIALVIVVPGRLRPAAAVAGVGLALGVSFSLVVLGQHFPSDVAGGFLLAAALACALLAVLRLAVQRGADPGASERWAVRTRLAVDRVATVGLVAALLAMSLIAAGMVLVAVLRLPDFTQYAQDHTAFVAVAGALGVGALVLLGAFAGLLARQR